MHPHTHAEVDSESVLAVLMERLFWSRLLHTRQRNTILPVYGFPPSIVGPFYAAGIERLFFAECLPVQM